MWKLLSTKTFVALALLLTLGTLAWVSRAAAEDGEAPAVTSIFEVEGMTCGGCEASVRMAVKRLDGVREVTASHTEKRAAVTYDAQKVTPQAIVEAIEKLGYTAKLVETKAATAEPQASGLLARLRAYC